MDQSWTMAKLRLNSWRNWWNSTRTRRSSIGNSHTRWHSRHCLDDVPSLSLFVNFIFADFMRHWLILQEATISGWCAYTRWGEIHHLRWHSRAILWFNEHFQNKRSSIWNESVFVQRWFRWSRLILRWMYIHIVRFQIALSKSLLFIARQSRKLQYESNVRIFGWGWGKIHENHVEYVHASVQLAAVVSLLE